MEEKLNLEFSREDLFRLYISKLYFLGNHFSTFCTFADFFLKSMRGGESYKELHNRCWPYGGEKELIFKDEKSLRRYIKRHFEKPEEKNRYHRIFKSFLSPDYEAPVFKTGKPDPNILVKINHHFECLLYYYFFEALEMPAEVTAFVDLAMAKLVASTTQSFWAFNKEGYYRDRISSSIKAKNTHKAERKQFVLEVYHRDKKILPDMKLHSVATIIKKDLGEKLQSPPSIDTIKRYLKEEGIF